MEQIKKELIEEAKYELFHYPVTTKKEDIKYIIKRIIRLNHTPKRDSFYWTHAMLTQALEEAEEIDTLKKYYDAWIDKGIPVYNVDNVMNGYSLLHVFEKTADEKYKQAADTLYAWMKDYVKQMGNPLPYRKNHPTHVYVDGLGMIVPFLCRYGAMFDNQDAMELGISQIVEFLKYGIDKESGLPYHGYDTKTKVKQGIIGWGRAVGWFMLALADSIEHLPEGEENRNLIEEYWKLAAKVENYIRPDGYFSWQLSALEGPKDTSATAMIGYALKKGRTFLEDIESKENGTEGNNAEKKNSVENILKRLQKALLNSCENGKIYDCSGECDGFSQYPQRYGAYPWSLGPGLRFLLMK